MNPNHVDRQDASRVGRDDVVQTAASCNVVAISANVYRATDLSALVINHAEVVDRRTSGEEIKLIELDAVTGSQYVKLRKYWLVFPATA